MHTKYIFCSQNFRRLLVIILRNIYDTFPYIIVIFSSKFNSASAEFVSTLVLENTVTRIIPSKPLRRVPHTRFPNRSTPLAHKIFPVKNLTNSGLAVAGRLVNLYQAWQCLALFFPTVVTPTPFTFQL